eukprot:scaffold161997_cov35-Attheya_sp.AAC.1
MASQTATSSGSPSFLFRRDLILTPESGKIVFRHDDIDRLQRRTTGWNEIHDSEVLATDPSSNAASSGGSNAGRLFGNGRRLLMIHIRYRPLYSAKSESTCKCKPISERVCSLPPSQGPYDRRLADELHMYILCTTIPEYAC